MCCSIVCIMLLVKNLLCRVLSRTRRIKKYLSRNSLLTLFHALSLALQIIVMAFCMACLSRKQLNCNSSMSASARLVLNLRKYGHIILLPRFMNFIGYEYNMVFILTLKAIHGLTPKYIIELINTLPRSIYNRRSNQSLLLDPPKAKMLVT